MSDQMEAGIAYAARGWLVFPTTTDKRPLTEHGRTDATADKEQIEGWFRRWPSANVAIATGGQSGVVALDVDMPLGPDSIEALAGPLHPITPTDHTPSGGYHLLFRHPGHFVKTIAGKLGVGLDIRGDGGSVTLPPGPGRYWDPYLGPETPLAEMPAWMIIAEPEPAAPIARPRRHQEISRYAEAALDGAVNAIVTAPRGEQRQTLNRECFAIGGLVAGGALPAAVALNLLIWGARQMPSHDTRRPWRGVDLDRQVRDSFLDGQKQPREVPRS